MRRLGVFALSVFVSSLLVFAVMSILPGDPAQVMLGTQATPAAVAELRERLGLNQPLITQYFSWLFSAVRGDFGVSPFSGQEIAPQIIDRLKLTIPLAVFAMSITVIISFPLGVFAAARHRKLGDAVVSFGSQIGLAIPAFWAGLILVTALAVNLRLFPAGGFPGWDVSLSESLKALVLPAVSLAIVQSSIITRYVRSAVLDTMRHDYIRTARAKGLTRSASLWKHGLRNAAIPVLTILGLQFAALLAGTVVIESVFVLPGLGSMLLQGITRRDLVLVQGGAFTIAMLILSINLFVDLMYRVLDPRVSQQ
ncbi:MAG: ABC transporter permease [Actinomycetota bacterium]|nr:ABC transporter permease [Actinomycetota bacterium]